MDGGIPLVLRGDPSSYMPILLKKGIPLTERNTAEVHKVLAWLHEKRRAGEFALVPADPGEKAQFIDKVKKQYKQQVYGSMMLLVIGVVIKIIISLIIDHYFD